MTKCQCMRGCKDDGSNYTWFPRQDPKTIKQCPCCKSTAWRTPRPEKVVEKTDGEKLEEINKGIERTLLRRKLTREHSIHCECVNCLGAKKHLSLIEIEEGR